ncbi:MAG: glycosyltransferase family 4 protein [Candidatus Kerfeldbacteria bacterium]|nr:glycosyltransferase family 4 protein [Candidatus Kerfeldbacteria bacterium]
MNPRICMLIERYWPLVGGSEIQCRLLTKALSQAGLPVFVITRRIHRSLPVDEIMDGVRIIRLPPSGFGRIWKELFFALNAARTLIRHRHEYDIIHLHSGTSFTGALTIMLAKVLRKKTVVKIATAGDIAKQRIETTDNPLGRPSGMHRSINRAINIILKRADRIVCLSQEIERELKQHGFPPKKLVILPNVVDTATFAPASLAEKQALRQQLNIHSEKTIFLFTGRFIHRKGIDVMLQAWKQLPDRSSAHLVLVGSGSTSLDSMESRLREAVRNDKLNDSVGFVPEQPSVVDYLRAADVFVFSSRREGLSNALLEAMSTGLPVIATAIGGNTDIIQDGRTGLLVPSEDATLLARRMTDLLSNEEQRRTLGANSRRFIRDHYDIDVLLPKFQQLYASLING